MPELAVGLVAAGALLALAVPRRSAAGLAGGLLLALAGLAAMLAPAAGVVAGPVPPGPQVAVAVTLLVGAGACLAAAPRAERAMLGAGLLAALAAAVAMAEGGPALLSGLLVLALAVGHAAAGPAERFSERLRGPALGALALALGILLAGGASGLLGQRASGALLVVGLALVSGLHPFGSPLDPAQPALLSPLPRSAFIGPAVAALLSARLLPTLPPEAGPGYVAMLAGLGVLNLAAGLAGGRLGDLAGAWRHSFAADWGLALIALALLNESATTGGLLILAALPMLRLPAYLLARPQLAAAQPGPAHPLNLALAAALAGAPPSTGFAARLLVLNGAAAVAWPVAGALALLMLAWLPLSIRLARSLGPPTPRRAAGLVTLLVVNLAIGLYPASLAELLGPG